MSITRNNEVEEYKDNNYPPLSGLWLVGGQPPLPIEGEFSYRGDANHFNIVFKEGFKPPGDDRDLFRHVFPPKKFLLSYSNPESAYISTTISKEIAAGFPYNIRPGTKHSYVYEIQIRKPTINVVSELSLHPELLSLDLDLINKEKERAVPFRIKSNEIKGCWPVDVIDINKLNAAELDLLSSNEPIKTTVNGHLRIMHDEFKPNPGYASSVISRYWNVAKKAGGILTGFGLYNDTTRLFEAIESGNDAYKTGVEIIGGWSGAYAGGAAGLKLGVTTCAPFIPYGPPICGFLGGLIGSAVGYQAGSKVTTHLYEKDEKHFTPAKKTVDLPSKSNFLFEQNKGDKNSKFRLLELSAGKDKKETEKIIKPMDISIPVLTSDLVEKKIELKNSVEQPIRQCIVLTGPDMPIDISKIRESFENQGCKVTSIGTGKRRLNSNDMDHLTELLSTHPDRSLLYLQVHGRVNTKSEHEIIWADDKGIKTKDFFKKVSNALGPLKPIDIVAFSCFSANVCNESATRLLPPGSNFVGLGYDLVSAYDTSLMMSLLQSNKKKVISADKMLQAYLARSESYNLPFPEMCSIYSKKLTTKLLEHKGKKFNAAEKKAVYRDLADYVPQEKLEEVMSKIENKNYVYSTDLFNKEYNTTYNGLELAIVHAASKSKELNYHPALKQISYEHWEKNEKSKEMREDFNFIPKMIQQDDKALYASSETQLWEHLLSKKSQKSSNPHIEPYYSKKAWVHLKAEDVKKGIDFSHYIRRPLWDKESKEPSSILLSNPYNLNQYNTHAIDLFKKLAPKAMPGLDQHSDYLLQQTKIRTGQSVIRADFMKSADFQETLHSLQLEQDLTFEQARLLALYTVGRFTEAKSILTTEKPDSALLKSSLNMLQTSLKIDLTEKPEKSVVYQLIKQTTEEIEDHYKERKSSLESITQTQNKIVAVFCLGSQIAALSHSPRVARQISALGNGVSHGLGAVAAFAAGNPLMGIVGAGNALCSFFGGFFGDDDSEEGLSVVSNQINDLHNEMNKRFHDVLLGQISLSQQMVSAYEQTMKRFDKVDYQLASLQQQMQQAYQALTAQNQYLNEQIIHVRERLDAVELNILRGLRVVHSDIVRCFQIIDESFNKRLILLDEQLHKGLTYLDKEIQLWGREMRVQTAEQMRLAGQYYESLKQEQSDQSIELKKHSEQFRVLNEEKMELDRVIYQKEKKEILRALTQDAERLLLTDFPIEEKEIAQIKYCLTQSNDSELTADNYNGKPKNSLIYLGNPNDWESINVFDIINLLRNNSSQTIREKYNKPLIHLPTQQKNILAYIKWLNKETVTPEQITFLKKEIDKIRELVRFSHAIGSPDLLQADFKNMEKQSLQLVKVLKHQLMVHQQVLAKQCQKRLQNRLSEDETFRMRLKNIESKEEFANCFDERRKENIVIELFNKKITVTHDRPMAYYVKPRKEEKSQYALALNLNKMPVLPKEILELEALGAGWILFNYQFSEKNKQLTIDIEFHQSRIDKGILLAIKSINVNQESEIEEAWKLFKWESPDILNILEMDRKMLQELHEKCIQELRLQLNYQLLYDFSMPELQQYRQAIDASVGLFHVKCKLIFENFYLNGDKTLHSCLQTCMTSEKWLCRLSHYSGSSGHIIDDFLQHAEKWYANLAEQLIKALSSRQLYVDNTTLTDVLLLFDNTLLEWILENERIAYCNDVLSTLPDAATVPLLLMRGTLFATEEKDCKAALADFKQAIEFHPLDSSIRLKYADCLMALGQKDEAIEQYNQLIGSLHENSSTPSKNILHQNKILNLGMLLVLRGDAYLAAEYTAAAFGDYQQACLLLSNQPEAFYKRGLCYELLEKFDLAIKDYQAVLKWDPNHDKSKEGLATCLTKVNRTSEAFTTYEALLQKYPDSPHYKKQCMQYCPLEDKRCLLWVKEIIKHPEVTTDDLLLCSELYAKRGDLPAAKLIYLRIKDKISTPKQIERFRVIFNDCNPSTQFKFFDVQEILKPLDISLLEKNKNTITGPTI